MNKKIIIIITAVIIVMIVSAGVYYFFTQKKETNINTNQVAINQPINLNTNNINKAPAPTYEKYTEEKGYVQFDTPQEWTKISPEEIEKVLPAEQKEKIKVLYYAVNIDGVIISVSKKSYTKGEKTFSQMLDDELSESQKSVPDYNITKDEKSEKEALYKASFTFQNNPSLSLTKALYVNQDQEKDWIYFMNFILKKDFVSRYQDIIDHLLDSFLTV